MMEAVAQQIDPRDALMDCQGHALVLGGPGSGKTTLALRKSLRRIRAGLRPGQTVLFLSFSRAAVARLIDAAKLEIPKAEMELLSMQTFHSLFWEILKAHAYLLGAPKTLSILLPHDAKAMSRGIEKNDKGWPAWEAERERLFVEEGRTTFDLFAPKVAELARRSALLRKLVASKHPLIIVDEAQDTDQNAWQFIELMAPLTQVICLADLEQQIFDFLPGVGAERIEEIKEKLHPLVADLAGQNHRSPDSEILAFANDILAGQARGAPYKGVSTLQYRPEKPPPDWNLVLRKSLSILHRRIRKETGGSAKSVALLVFNNKSALKLSNALNCVGAAHAGKQVRHRLMFDEAEAMLAARLTAFLLEPKGAGQVANDVAACMDMVADSRRATGTAMVASDKLAADAAKLRATGKYATNVAKSFRAVLDGLAAQGFKGEPYADWNRVKRALRDTGQSELERVAEQLEYLVAFRRGDRISAGLAAVWLRDQAYTKARDVLQSALAQDQLLNGTQPASGLQVMNIHKAKGKQFDGVIVVREARRTGEDVESSFVWWGDPAPHEKSRRIVRVAITRARSHALILDPLWPKCPLLRGHRL